MRLLECLEIKNFKSIREQSLELGALNVFIGGNGAGKSNLIEVFRFLREIVNGRLGAYTAKRGGANSLLHFGRKTSPAMELLFRFRWHDKANGYGVKLIGTDDDAFVFAEEKLFTDDIHKAVMQSPGGRETQIWGVKVDLTKQLREDLENYRLYHFQDTSDTALVKATQDLEDNRELRPQGENLAAFLYWMQQMRPKHFAMIEGTIRRVAPFFDGFRLAPSKLNETKIRLEWAEVGSDDYFNAAALSDGTLRFMCLATLLLQPELPPLLLLDEPELGLHPAAIVLLADLLSMASTRTQVIVATQSVTLVNQLEPKDLWTVERKNRQSVFRSLAKADMSTWLDGYAMGDLWEKNIIGARP